MRTKNVVTCGYLKDEKDKENVDRLSSLLR